MTREEEIERLARQMAAEYIATMKHKDMTPDTVQHSYKMWRLFAESARKKLSASEKAHG